MPRPQKTNFDFRLYDTLLDQVETAATTGGGMSNIATWIAANTRDDRDFNRNFSYSGHEYQVGILNDTHTHIAVRKATQVGLSTLSLRLALAVCAKFSGISAIYVMPSVRAAQKFATSRANPVIDASPRLKSLLDREAASNEMKKIGSSYLFFTGAAASTSAISIPARALFVDEMAFASPEIISIFVSRLGHQKEEEKIVRYFSSPLHPNSDISKLFDDGTQNIYLTYHDRCQSWVVVDPVEHMVIPGFDDHLTNIAYSDLDDPKNRIADAFWQCEKCHQPVSIANLSDPTRRAWVPRYPDRFMASYDANPLVLPQLRTPQALLADLALYKSTTRFLQFAMGVPAESASDMILDAALDRAFTVRPVGPTDGGVYGAVMGCDVGKLSYYVIGKKVGATFEVFYMDNVRQTPDNATGLRLVERYQQFNCVQGIIDSAPDISLPLWLQTKLPYGQIWGAYFVRGRGKANLDTVETVIDSGTIKIARSRAFDGFVEAFNKGLIRLPAGMPREPEVRAHLQRMKRVINYDATGDESVIWTATDKENHWLLALLYAWLAAEQVGTSTSIVQGLDLSRLIAKVKMPGGVGNPLGGNSGMGGMGVRGLGAGFGR